MVDIEKLVNTPLDASALCGTYSRFRQVGADEYYAARGYCSMVAMAKSALCATFTLAECEGRWCYSFRGPLSIGWRTPQFRLGEEFLVDQPGVQPVLQTVVGDTLAHLPTRTHICTYVHT